MIERIIRTAAEFSVSATIYAAMTYALPDRWYWWLWSVGWLLATVIGALVRFEWREA
jgi:hypothetical protein